VKKQRGARSIVAQSESGECAWGELDKSDQLSLFIFIISIVVVVGTGDKWTRLMNLPKSVRLRDASRRTRERQRHVGARAARHREKVCRKTR
jgi:hypothetical protein